MNDFTEFMKKILSRRSILKGLFFLCYEQFVHTIYLMTLSREVKCVGIRLHNSPAVCDLRH